MSERLAQRDNACHFCRGRYLRAPWMQRSISRTRARWLIPTGADPVRARDHAIVRRLQRDEWSGADLDPWREMRAGRIES
jgi:hypothetical protein